MCGCSATTKAHDRRTVTYREVHRSQMSPACRKACTEDGHIVVDEAFWRSATRAQQDAALAHELAHVDGVSCEGCADRIAGFHLHAWGYSRQAAVDALSAVVTVRPQVGTSVAAGWDERASQTPYSPRSPAMSLDGFFRPTGRGTGSDLLGVFTAPQQATSSTTATLAPASNGTVNVEIPRTTPVVTSPDVLVPAVVASPAPAQATAPVRDGVLTGVIVSLIVIALTASCASRPEVIAYQGGVLDVAHSMAATANVAPPIPGSPTAQQYALAGLGRTASWTEAVSSAAGEDLWVSAAVPAELTNAVRSQIRYVEVIVSDATDAAIPVCVRLGPATNSPTLSCVAGAMNGKYLAALGSSVTLQVRPIQDQSVAASSVVPLWAIGSSATAVDVTVTVGW